MGQSAALDLASEKVLIKHNTFFAFLRQVVSSHRAMRSCPRLDGAVEILANVASSCHAGPRFFLPVARLASEHFSKWQGSSRVPNELLQCFLSRRASSHMAPHGLRSTALAFAVRDRRCRSLGLHCKLGALWARVLLRGPCLIVPHGTTRSAQHCVSVCSASPTMQETGLARHARLSMGVCTFKRCAPHVSSGTSDRLADCGTSSALYGRSYSEEVRAE